MSNGALITDPAAAVDQCTYCAGPVPAGESFCSDCRNFDPYSERVYQRELVAVAQEYWVATLEGGVA